MPHFAIDCSQPVIELQDPEKIMKRVHDAAEASGLFGKGDIKVRINPFKYYNIGNGKGNFIHVFGNLLEGRTIDQKNDLSR